MTVLCSHHAREPVMFDWYFDASVHTSFLFSFPFFDTLLIHHLCCHFYSYLQPRVKLMFLDSSLTCSSHHSICSAVHIGPCVLHHEVCTHP